METKPKARVKLLIVGDREGPRKQLALAFRSRGFAVETAASGRQAIDVGCGFRPDVLITDWGLRDQIHGVQVGEVLRLLRPDLEVILMTASPSEDLEYEARRADVWELIEKPFELERLERAVAGAASGVGRRRPSVPIGVLETTAGGDILFASPRALELLDETSVGRGAASLGEVLPATGRPSLTGSATEWLEVRPVAEPPVIWQVRSREHAGEDRRTVVLIHGEQCLALLDRGPEPYHYDFLVRKLLGLPARESSRWPFGGRALLVDPSLMLRRLAVVEIEQSGGMCYSIDSCRRAAEIFRHDAGIAIVLIDDDLLGSEAAELIRLARAADREVAIVGLGAADRQSDFARYGIDAVLEPPLEIDRLLRAMSGPR